MSRTKLNQIQLNVLSSYLALAQRMFTGLFSFHLLYTHLSPEKFGYWALLWSVFGFSSFLDFGFGMTVQKNVAQLSHNPDWSQLNRTLSTIFFTYCGLALLICVGATIASDHWVAVMGISRENSQEFALLFRVFLYSMALMFPLGLFSEVLRGLQRIALANVLHMSCSLVSFVGIMWSLLTYQPLLTVLLFSLGAVILPAILSIYYSFRLAPSLRIKLTLFSKSDLRSATSFSFAAYFIMISYIIMTKNDLLVLGAMMTVRSVAIYQPGSKLAELYSMLTNQLSRVLQPAAAKLYSTGNSQELSKLLVGGIRYSALLSTPTYLGAAFYLSTLIRALTGEHHPSAETLLVAQTLLLWSYSFLLTHNVYKGIALMGGHERRLLLIGIAEAGANLILSVAAVVHFKRVLGVAVATLVPSLTIGWGVLWGWAAKEAGLNRVDLWRQTLAKNWLANLPMLAVLILLYVLGWTSDNAGPWRIFSGMLLAASIGALFIWRIALSDEDRGQVLSHLPRRRVKLS